MPAPRLHNATELSTLDENETLFCGKFVAYYQIFLQNSDFFGSFIWKKSCDCAILKLRFYRHIMNMLANCAILW